MPSLSRTRLEVLDDATSDAVALYRLRRDMVARDPRIAALPASVFRARVAASPAALASLARRTRGHASHVTTATAATFRALVDVDPLAVFLDLLLPALVDVVDLEVPPGALRQPPPPRPVTSPDVLCDVAPTHGPTSHG